MGMLPLRIAYYFVTALRERRSCVCIRSASAFQRRAQTGAQSNGRKRSLFDSNTKAHHTHSRIPAPRTNSGPKQQQKGELF
jgi:hypothetical protein